MSMDAPTVDTEHLHLRPQSAAAARTGTFVLQPILATDQQLEYCLRLAHRNMSPYLDRRGEKFDDGRWRQLAPRAEFYLIADRANALTQTVGFVSVRREPDRPCALHIGDVQIDAEYQNNGAGSAALCWIEDVARTRSLSELTLHVFRDNPALRLYERFGFKLIDTEFYKCKMRKTLFA